MTFYVFASHLDGSITRHRGRLELLLVEAVAAAAAALATTSSGAVASPV